jgi:transposase
MSERFTWLAPMALWPTARPLLPRSVARLQGGGAQRADDEAMFAAISFVLVTNSAWRVMPKVFGVSWQTAHRRFGEWSRHALWSRLADSAAGSGHPSVEHWAKVLAAAAAGRGPATVSADDGKNAPTVHPPVRRSAIRRHLSTEFAEQIFGPRREQYEEPQ